MDDISVSITEKADKRLAMLASKEVKLGAMLRITVEGGGCSGFQYDMVFPEWEKQQGDRVFKGKDYGGCVVVDAISLSFLDQAIIDYKETLGDSRFEIKNPNTTAQCGCGNSFNVM